MLRNYVHFSYELHIKNYILYSKYSSDVVNPLHPSVLLRHVEGSGDQVFLVILNLDHFPLDRLVGDELVDEDRLGLAEPVDSVKALPLKAVFSYYKQFDQVYHYKPHWPGSRRDPAGGDDWQL